MRTKIFFAAMLLLAFGSVKAQENKDPQVKAIQVCGSGKVRIQQFADRFSLMRDDRFTSEYDVENGTLVLSGSSGYVVGIQKLEKIQIGGSGDVRGQGILKGQNLAIDSDGSGDLWMNVQYDTIRINMSGSGDIALQGECKALYAEMHGSGDLDVHQLVCQESYINSEGSGDAWTDNSGKVVSYSYQRMKKKSDKGLLFDAHWNGVEAGLNMLFNTKVSDVTLYPDGIYADEIYLGIRPLRSWYFGFNIADVGVAFNKKHTAGLFTGIGIGWNNFSWKEPVMTQQDPETGMIIQVPLTPDEPIVKSKLGLLYLQVPMMVEIRPTRHMYVDLGLTYGLRFAAWNKVKYVDGSKYTTNVNGGGHFMNLFKMDASLRVGSDYLGFFMNYGLIPIYHDDVIENTHPLSFGLSVNF